MDETLLDQLGAGKYLLVTSYRKNGTPVATPVWVVRDGDTLGVWTPAESWKVKRIRARGDVLVGSCDVRGNPTGNQVPATAEICDRLEAVTDVGVPNVALTEYKAPENYKTDACPLCKAGTPITRF